MDHRCLYGHRVSAEFTYAIRQRTCPVCGAETVTVEAYRLARKLATEASLEATRAFEVASVLDRHYTLVPKNPEAPPAPEVSGQSDEGVAVAVVEDDAVPGASPSESEKSELARELARAAKDRAQTSGQRNLAPSMTHFRVGEDDEGLPPTVVSEPTDPAAERDELPPTVISQPAG